MNCRRGLLTTPAGCVATANTNVVVSTIAAPAAITGANSVCVGSTIALNNITPNGRWSSIAGRATVNSVTGVVTGSNAGTATIQYSVSNLAGCVAVATKSITVNAIPATPSIGYKAPFSNPQQGAPTGGFCVGKIFGVTGNPVGGTWSTTGCISVTAGGIATINTTSAGSLTYTHTNANGCSNARTMIGVGYNCAARQVKRDSENQNPKNIVLFPNPTTDFLNLKVANGDAKQVRMFNSLGKTVYTNIENRTSYIVNLTSLSSGTYFVEILTSDGRREVEKFIKN